MLLELGDGPLDDVVPMPPEVARAAARVQLQFQAGRYCARRALNALEPGLACWVARGADRAPVWPSDIVGSITHTKGFSSSAVAFASDFAGLGIDAETVMSDDRARNVAAAIASSSELAGVRRDGWSEGLALTVLFSAKESLYKCIYPLVRRRFGFHDVCIADVDTRRQAFLARMVTTVDARFPVNSVFEGRFALRGAMVHTAVVLPAGG
jgi:enterobactin synthetase component D